MRLLDWLRRKKKPEQAIVEDDSIIPRPEKHEGNHDGISCAHCNSPLSGEALHSRENDKWYCNRQCLIWETFESGNMIVASLEEVPS